MILAEQKFEVETSPVKVTCYKIMAQWPFLCRKVIIKLLHKFNSVPLNMEVESGTVAESVHFIERKVVYVQNFLLHSYFQAHQGDIPSKQSFMVAHHFPFFIVVIERDAP